MGTVASRQVPQSRDRILFPSRLIPGGAPVESRRKEIARATTALERSYSEKRRLVSSDIAPFWRTLARNILPSPTTANQRLRLLWLVLNDVAVVALGTVLTRVCAALLTGEQLRTTALFGNSGLLILYGSVLTLIGYSERLYHPETLRNFAVQRFILLKAVTWSTLLLCIALLSCANPGVLLAEIACSAPVDFFLLLASRRYERWRVTKHGRCARAVRNVLIVGAGTSGRKVARFLEQDCVDPRVVRGFLDDNYPRAADVLGAIEDLSYIARREFIDEIIVTLPLQGEAAQTAIRQARHNRLDVRVIPFVPATEPVAFALEMFGDTPILTLHEEAVPSIGLLLKRGADIVMSAVALLLLAPLIGVIALAIKLDSRGPAIYRAPRVGFKGMKFVCYKFRTMSVDADRSKERLRQQNERKGAFFKIKDDPRITRIGNILRRYSLDELPQLWNVLRGEMSLVGPRPHPVDDAARYRIEDLQRLEVMPGLTGLWQVTARTDPSFERSMALDREYIGRWSLGMDLQILCKTVGTVLRGSGS